MRPQSHPGAQTTRTLSCRCRKLTPHRAWPQTVGAAVILLLSVAWPVPGAPGPDPAGFSRDCTGFAQDALLRPFGLEQLAPQSEPSAAALGAMVPRIATRGTALATYERRRGVQPITTLETLFGLSQGAKREIAEAVFAQEGRAVALSEHILATVAHALTPDAVEVHVVQQTSVQTVPLRLTSTTVLAHTAPDAPGVPVQVAHTNAPYDLALLQADDNRRLQPLPYPAVLSYGRGNPEKPVGGLQAGDCVATVVTVRDDNRHDSGQDRLVLGKVLAKVPVATNSLTQTKLNVNMFTTDLPVQPGDSGSPVLALWDGKPVLVGLVSATMYPTATFTYVTRIDPLIALAGALQQAGTHYAESRSDSLPPRIRRVFGE
jgi:S1-C subfamily serine protease